MTYCLTNAKALGIYLAACRTIVARLVSAAGTGFFYTVKRQRLKERMILRKYDPVVRRHVLFMEQKKK